MAGSGGIGVGAWQAYEGFFSEGSGDTSTPVKREGYSWTPPTVPNEDVSRDTNNKFNWNKWDCVNKLFPKVDVKKEESTLETTEVNFVREMEHNITTYTSHNKKKIYFEKPTDVTDDLLVCALLDHRGGNDGSKENIHFKSEVAVKDKDYGWVMWNGLTTKKGRSPSLYMEYRLLLLKKKSNGSEWEIDKGYGWSSSQSSDSSDYVYDQLSVVPPAGDWRPTNAKKGGYSQRRVWSAVAKVGTPVKPKPSGTEDDEVDGDDVVSSLKIYMKSKSSDGGRKGEFFGNGPNWNTTTAGYAKADRVYVANQSWQKIKDSIDLGDTLTEWYSPTEKKKIKWMTCEEWALENPSDDNLSSVDQAIRDLCYSKVA